MNSVYRLQEGSPLIGAECVICFEEFKVFTGVFVILTNIHRLARGYPGRTVCAIFIGAAFEIGFG